MLQEDFQDTIYTNNLYVITDYLLTMCQKR